MAIDILLWGQTCLHESKHDLESVFYVLIWLCVIYDGPNDSERKGFSVHHTELRNWLEGDNAKSIGRQKYTMMMNPNSFKLELLPLFSPYFDDLKPCVSALREAIILSVTPITHDAMIDILREAYDSLPEVEDVAPKNVYGTSKRKLGSIYEDEDPEDEGGTGEIDGTVEKLGDKKSQKRLVEPSVSKAASCPSNLPSRKPSKRMRSEELDEDD